jgi:hypothetical protein
MDPRTIMQLSWERELEIRREVNRRPKYNGLETDSNEQTRSHSRLPRFLQIIDWVSRKRNHNTAC